MSTSGSSDQTDERSDQLRRWRRITRVLQGALAIGVFAGAWLLVFDRGDGPAPVLPDTQEQFSLDLAVIGTADHDVVYAVEQRARPAYRIFAFDPATGDEETVFAVPDDAIVFGIDLSPDRQSLAVAYSTDFEVNGSGLSLLDLDTGELSEVTPARTDVYLTDVAWSHDGDSVLATRVDRTADDEQLAVAEIELSTGAITVLVDHAISPAVDGDDLYFLTVDDDLGRRSIGLYDDAGDRGVVALAESDADLDHLLAGVSNGSLHVAVLDSPDAVGLTVGDTASAHGNHNVASTWWDVVPGDDVSPARSIGTDSIVTYDAADTASGIVSATLTGLSITVDDQRVELIASRAIRFVAG